MTITRVVGEKMNTCALRDEIIKVLEDKKELLTE